jgi:hypothetical protein
MTDTKQDTRQPDRDTSADTSPDPSLTTEDIAEGTPRVDRNGATRTDDLSRDRMAQERRADPHRVETRRTDDDERSPLFDQGTSDDLRDRWTDVQAGFVDEPRSAVERADGLVAEAMQRLADSFAKERKALEDQWSRGDDVSTEDLRVALQRYRSFFDRLLSI